MNNEDLTVLGSDPLVAQEGATINPRPEDAAEPLRAGRAPTQTFSRALKAALDRVSPVSGRTEPGWGTTPEVAGLAAGRVPAENGPRAGSDAATTGPGTGGSLPDLNALSPGLAALLAAEPAGAHESGPTEGDTTHLGGVAPSGGAADGGAGSPAGEAGARQGTPWAWSTSDRNQGPTAAPGGPAGTAGAWPGGPVAGHPGPTDLISLAASATGGRDAGWPAGDHGRDTATAPPDRPGGAVALPGVNPVADQLAFTPGAPGAAGASPYSVDVPESSVGSTAFGPVLSGAVAPGPGYGGPPGLAASGADEGGGRASDSWAGLPSPEGADPANGPAMDLSRTNELLQQLLDEVRRGRQPFLPVNDRNTSL